MKTLMMALLLTTSPFLAPTMAMAQVVIYNEEDPDSYSGEADTEAQFLADWNDRHNARQRHGEGRRDFGPDDVIRLLERRGYRVRDVKDVGERYIVRATRGGDDLLVSVSRRGDIMGVVHDQGR